MEDNEIYFTPERCKAIVEKIRTNNTAFITWHILGKTCDEIIRLNEENARLCKQNKLLRRVREYWRNRSDEQVDNYVGLLGESYKLREQVRYRGIGEEQPSEGEEIITIDDNLSANLICYFSEEKEHWINQGVRWMPLPQPPEEVE